MKINWPTAITLTTFIAGYAALLITNHDIPVWMGAMGAIATNIALSMMPPALRPKESYELDTPPMGIPRVGP
jgi:hypothetical protein